MKDHLAICNVLFQSSPHCITVAALVGLLPPLAALVSILWGGLQIYYLVKKHRTPKK